MHHLLKPIFRATIGSTFRWCETDASVNSCDGRVVKALDLKSNSRVGSNPTRSDKTFLYPFTCFLNYFLDAHSEEKRRSIECDTR